MNTVALIILALFFTLFAILLLVVAMAILMQQIGKINTRWPAWFEKHWFLYLGLNVVSALINMHITKMSFNHVVIAILLSIVCCIIDVKLLIGYAHNWKSN